MSKGAKDADVDRLTLDKLWKAAFQAYGSVLGDKPEAVALRRYIEQSLSQEAVRDEALEEAARVAEAVVQVKHSACSTQPMGSMGGYSGEHIAECPYAIASAIRALKREPNAAVWPKHVVDEDGTVRPVCSGEPNAAAPADVEIDYISSGDPTMGEPGFYWRKENSEGGPFATETEARTAAAAPVVASMVTFPDDCDFWTADQWKAVAKRYHTEWRQAVGVAARARSNMRDAERVTNGLLGQRWIPVDRTAEYQEHHFKVEDVGVAWNGNRVWVCADSGALLRAKVMGEKLFVEFTPPAPGASDE